MDNLSIIFALLISSTISAQTLTFPGGATGSPAPPSTSVQYNNSGSMGGVSGVGAYTDGLLFYDISTPTNTAGKTLLNGVPSGIEVTEELGIPYLLQPQFTSSRFEFVPYGSNTTATTVGGATTTAGTASGIAPTSGSAYHAARKIRYTSSASTFSGAGWTQTTRPMIRGTAGEGGFTASFNFASASPSSTSICFVGLCDQTSNADITSTSFAGIRTFIGMGYDHNDNNYYIIHNDNTGAPTKIDLGSSFPTTGVSQAWYNLYLYCPSSGNYIYYRVTNITNKAIAEGTITGSELPSTSTYLGARVITSTGSFTTPAVMDIGRVYCEYN